MKCSLFNVGYYEIFDLDVDSDQVVSILSNNAIYKISTRQDFLSNIGIFNVVDIGVNF